MKPESNKPPKELIEFLEKKLYIKERGLKNKLAEITQKIETSIEPGKKRFEKLEKQIDNQFGIDTPKRGALDGLCYFLMDSAFELYFIGNNSALFIELQGILERFCINRSADFIAVNDDAKSLLLDSFSKKTLNDIAEYFKTISFWNEEDIKFAKKLTHIRNGIAHKNVSLVSKHLSDGKQTIFYSIDDITKKVDTIPFIIHTMELILKVLDLDKPKAINNPRFLARFEAFSEAIPHVFNLFLEQGFVTFPNAVKYTMISRIFSQSTLLGSQKLRELLGDFKIKVLEFQELLGVEEKASQNLHNELIKLGSEIFDEMRLLLEIDGNPDIFIKPSIIDSSKIK
jgi:hypothetical protein